MLRSLRARYYLVFVGIATIPILLLGLFAGMRSASELEHQSLILQRELAARIEHDIASFVSARQNELRVLERTIGLVDMDNAELSATLGRMLAHDQVYQDLLVLEVDGRIQVFVSRIDISPRAAMRWFEAPFAQPAYWLDENQFVGPVEYDADLREPLLDVAIPILERRTGEMAGILLARVRFKPIWDLLADLRLPQETEAFVVNAQGRVLAHRSPAVVLSASVFELPSEDGRHKLGDGRPGLVAIQALSLVGEPAFVVVTRPLGAALANANETRTTTWVSAVVLLIAASLLALHQSRGIVRPVETLARLARGISGGELDTRIEVSGPREIVALGHGLQEMAERLRQTITELERSEYVERRRATVTLESIGDAVVTTDSEGTVTYINPVAASLTGWSLEEARGQPINELFRVIDEQSRALALNPIAPCLASGQIVDAANNMILLSREGHESSIFASAAPIREPGDEVLGAVMVFRDITERKTMEKALRHSQKMDAIGQLTAGIAHDFNNLMQAIQGNAELLAEDPNHDPTLTSPILKAVESGAELTSRLLAFARKQTLMPRAVDIPGAVSGMLTILDRTLGESVEVSLELGREIWPANIDPGQLEAALLNLALNARDAMPKGGRLVISGKNARLTDSSLEDDCGRGERDFVCLAVSDNGVGMTAETQERAVDPFYTTKGFGDGSGLGLSMVYGFVNQSGGHLEIESEGGVGTTVTMFLPRSRKVREFALTNGSTKVMKGHGETILVVEDDAEVRALARRTLEDLGYRVVEAETVATARKALDQAEDVDLVLTDVVLPGGISGLDFAREINATRPNLPVALMSGYPETISAEGDLIAAETVLLNKPFQRSQLASMLRDFLDRPKHIGAPI